MIIITVLTKENDSGAPLLGLAKSIHYNTDNWKIVYTKISTTIAFLFRK